MSVQAGPSAVRPEDLDEFRQARLLLVLSRLGSEGPSVPPDLERVSFYDFFSANPFLIPAGAHDRAALSFAGFDISNLSYQSSSQRFANNRARLQFDLAILAARGLVRPEIQGRRVTYGVTESGRSVAESFRSLYADAFRGSAALIVDKLRRMSDSALRTSAKEWLRADDLMIDLYEPEQALP